MKTMRLSEFLKLDPATLDMAASYIRDEAPGAWPNGTRVVKLVQEPTDAHAVGAEAVVLGSLGPASYMQHQSIYGYFVEWDDTPGIPCFVLSTRIGKK